MMAAATAIVGYTVRACLPPRRRVGLVLLGGLGVLFGLLSHVATDMSDALAVVRITGSGFFALVVPLASLVVGDAVIGAEIRSGTFGFTWLSPVPVRTIVLGRWVAGTSLACAVLVPAGVLAAVVAGTPALADEMALAIAAAVAAYIALFVAIGVTFKRSTVAALIFVFLVERLLGAAISGIAQVSPTWLGRSVFTGLIGDSVDEVARGGVPSGWSAVARLALVTVLALLLAARGLRRLRMTGAAD